MRTRTRFTLALVGIALSMLLYYGLIAYAVFGSATYGSIASWNPHAKPVTWVVSPRVLFRTRPVYDLMTGKKEIGRARNGRRCRQFVRGGPGDQEWRIYKLRNGRHGMTLCEPRR